MGMSRIFWDTNLFIYLLEPNDEFSAMTKKLRTKMLTRGDQLFTSTITLGEVLVKPTQAGDTQRLLNYNPATSCATISIHFDCTRAQHHAFSRGDQCVQPA